MISVKLHTRYILLRFYYQTGMQTTEMHTEYYQTGEQTTEMHTEYYQTGEQTSEMHTEYYQTGEQTTEMHTTSEPKLFSSRYEKCAMDVL